MHYDIQTADEPRFSLQVAEPGGGYDSSCEGQRGTPGPEGQLIEVLVDCPNTEEKLFTYRVPQGLNVQPGDILSVPFGTQQLGAIAIRAVSQLPPGLTPEQIKEVEEVVVAGFFPVAYWQLLERVGYYYYTPLIQVIKAALPPGLLSRSQRRIRLVPENLANGAGDFLRLAARQVLEVLQASKNGDLSQREIQRQVRGARLGIEDLIKRGWVEKYLELPSPPRPKLRQAVVLIGDGFPGLDLSDRQQKVLREVLGVLRLSGGAVWLTELLNMCRTSTRTLKALEQTGCFAIEEREVLRSPTSPDVAADLPKALTKHQARALEVIAGISGFAQVLLHGVTGSGKTEVYMQAIAPLLQRGQSALVLVPEIGLTPQLTDRFRARFGDKVAVYHSALSDGERYDSWRQMLTGTPQIVIGTRSAIFAPLPQIGLIVLDEEYDNSYKQDQPAPTYHARTVAKWRAELANCPLILGSATPSLETWVDISNQNSLYLPITPTPTHYISLPERIHGRRMPPVEIVDMRQELRKGNKSIFSQWLQQGLNNMLANGQQGILFIHRRGHSTFVSCRSCGYVVECPNCDVSLAYHQTQEGETQEETRSLSSLRCHYCNYVRTYPQRCPECDSPYFKHFGSGTQRVEQELAKQFPPMRVIRFDSDTTRTKDAHRILLTRFANREADLLIGTQMLTKGLDLPQVTLVGVIAADGLLNMGDYRASERAFQTLTQVAGRAGRGDDPGRVVIQTYTPEHQVIEAVRRHDYESFIEGELEQRSALNYPPYGRLILLRVTGADEGEVKETAEQLATVLSPQEAPVYEVLGPAPAPVMRVANRYRWQILLKFLPDVSVELPSVEELRSRSRCPRDVSLAIDVDPLNLG